jgi:hypothetical protein
MSSGLKDTLIDPEQLNQIESFAKIRPAGKRLSHQDHDKSYQNKIISK